LDAEKVEPYLRSLIANERYQQKWEFYTQTDAIGKIQQPKAFSELDIGLMVQLMQPKKAEDDRNREQKEKTERLPVVEGIFKYAAEHVLLMGRPGSGKSTALLRLLVEKARQALKDPSARIPVLVELRYLDAERPSVLGRVEAFLRSHDLVLEEAILKQALTEGRLLLLMDGVNELPSEAARCTVAHFRQDYPKTPMVFTTRDVALGGDLEIERKLEMHPLSEIQMRQFVQAYLPEQGEPMLRQLQGRLREVGQTPLLLWMLCQVFQGLQQIPSSLGLLFRWFTEEYGRLKQDVPVSAGLHHWQAELLQHLAFTMMQAEESTELRVAIPRQEAESVLAVFLQGKVDYPTQRAKEWLEDLLEHHLIQPTSQNQLEFHHQLLQEYYAAEALLRRLPYLSDEQLKREYLNYLKWTEPLALMLALMDHQPQAIRVVKLALEVDWILGAKLAGEVKSELQLKTVEVVQSAKIPLSVKPWILGHTRSEFALTLPLIDLKHSDSWMRWRAVDSLRLIGSDKVIPELIKILKEDPEKSVRQLSVVALGEIGSELAVLDLLEEIKNRKDYYGLLFIALGQIGSEIALQGLLDIFDDPYLYYPSNLLSFSYLSNFLDAVTQNISERTIPTAIPKLLEALECHDIRVSGLAGQILSQINLKELPQDLLKALEDPDVRIRWNAIKAFGGCSTESDIKTLLEAYKTQQNVYVRRSIITAIGQFASESAIPGLTEALKDSDASVRWSVVEALGHIGSEIIIPLLISTLEDQDIEVCQNAVAILGEIRAKTAVDALLKLLKDNNSTKRRIAAEALGEICSEIAVPNLIQALNDPNSSVRSSAAWALGKMSSEATVPNLIQALNDPDSSTCRNAAWALGKMNSEAAVPDLIKALKIQDSFAREGIIEALGQIGSELAVPKLLKILDETSRRYSNRKVCVKTVESLGQIGSELAVPKLLEILQYLKVWNDPDCRSYRLPPSLWEFSTTERLMVAKAFESLGKIGTENAVLGLVEFLRLEMTQIETYHLNFIGDDDSLALAIKALGHINSETAIQGLMLAFSHSSSAVRNLAAIALENGQGDLLAKYLSFLKQRLTLPDSDGWEELKAISYVQAKCRFYNYEIWQATVQN
jgi:HEAT repeat protein